MSENVKPGYYWARWAGVSNRKIMPFIVCVVEVYFRGRDISEAYQVGDDVPFPLSSIVILSGPLEEPKLDE